MTSYFFTKGKKGYFDGTHEQVKQRVGRGGVGGVAWRGVAGRGNRTDSPYERKGRRQEFVMVSPEETHEDEYVPLVGKAVDLRCVKVHLDRRLTAFPAFRASVWHLLMSH